MAAQRTLVLALAALLPLVAGAEEQGGTSACRADAQKYCASAGNKMECLIDHQNDITDACYGFLKEKLHKEKQRLQQEKQEKQGSSEPAPAAASAPVSNPIYKVKTADGRTIYTNAPLAGAHEVPIRSEVR
jgi:hypothetical protein